VTIRAISGFGRAWLSNHGRRGLIRMITDHVRFSDHPGPWLLIEQNHFERWINLSADHHFRVNWSGWQ